MTYMVGIDTGGTFTDAVIVDEKGAITRGKALTTPKNFVIGVENALNTTAKNLQTALQQLLSETRVFCFGTTIGTNAIATTLDIYSHTVPGMQKAAAERLETLLPKTEEIENVSKWRWGRV